MLQQLLRNQGSYWYLPDDTGINNNEYTARIAPIRWQSDAPPHVSSSPSPSCLPVIDRVIKAAREKTLKATRSKPEETLSVEAAKQLQTDFTTWPSTIWDTNLNDSDGEIVFDFPNGSSDSDDGDCNEVLLVNGDCTKSVDTLETDEETTSIPSPSSLLEGHNTWEQQELDLSDIPVEHDLSYFDSPLRGPLAPDKLGEQRGSPISANLVGQTLDPERPCHAHDGSFNSFDFSSLIVAESDSTDSGEFVQQQQPAIPIPPKLKNPVKRLRFADEEGKQMEVVHLIDAHDYYHDPAQRRILFLLLLPEERTFEFVHAEYCIEARLPISSLLRQLPKMVKDSKIMKQTYHGLCKATGGAELINALAIQDYRLNTDEILVAVPKGYTGKCMYDIAKGLVENKKVLKAVKRTHRREHVLHRFKQDQGFVEKQRDRFNRWKHGDEPIETGDNDVSSSNRSRGKGKSSKHSSDAGAKVELEVSVEFRRSIERSMRRFSHPLTLERSINSEDDGARRRINDRVPFQRLSDGDELEEDNKQTPKENLPSFRSVVGSRSPPRTGSPRTTGPAIVVGPPQKSLLQRKKLFQRKESPTKPRNIVDEPCQEQAGKSNWARRFAKKLKIGGKRMKHFVAS